VLKATFVLRCWSCRDGCSGFGDEMKSWNIKVWPGQSHTASASHLL
jgi:hypothetical protein